MSGTRSKISEMNKTLRMDFAYAGERAAGGWAMAAGSWGIKTKRGLKMQADAGQKEERRRADEDEKEAEISGQLYV